MLLGDGCIQDDAVHKMESHSDHLFVQEIVVEVVVEVVDRKRSPVAVQPGGLKGVKGLLVQLLLGGPMHTCTFGAAVAAMAAAAAAAVSVLRGPNSIQVPFSKMKRNVHMKKKRGNITNRY